MTPEQLRYESLRSMVDQMQADHVAMKCLLPVLLAEISALSDGDPSEFMRNAHEQAARLIQGHVAGDGAGARALRERATSSLDTLVTAVRVTRID